LGIKGAAVEPPFLGRKADELDGVVERRGGQHPGDFQDGRRSAGVVVGPGGEGFRLVADGIIVGADDDDPVRDGLSGQGGDDVPALALSPGKGERLVLAGQAELDEAVIKKRPGVLAGGGRGIARLEILKALNGLGQLGLRNAGDPFEDPGIRNDRLDRSGRGFPGGRPPRPDDGPVEIEPFQPESRRDNLAGIPGGRGKEPDALFERNRRPEPDENVPLLGPGRSDKKIDFPFRLPVEDDRRNAGFGQFPGESGGA